MLIKRKTGVLQCQAVHLLLALSGLGYEKAVGPLSGQSGMSELDALRCISRMTPKRAFY